MKKLKRKQLNMMIVEIDAGIDFDNLSDELKQAIYSGLIQWPENQLSNTKIVDSKRLILILSYIKPKKLEKWINQGFPYRAKRDKRPAEELEEIDLGISWKILAVENKKIKQADILPYIVDDSIYDENGEFVEFKPVTDLTGKLQTWAGRKWVYHDLDN